MPITHSNWKEDNQGATEFCIRIRTNIHRSKNSLFYLEKCSHLNILPEFTKVGKSVVEKSNLNRLEVCKK